MISVSNTYYPSNIHQVEPSRISFRQNDFTKVFVGSQKIWPVSSYSITTSEDVDNLVNSYGDYGYEKIERGRFIAGIPREFRASTTDSGALYSIFQNLPESVSILDLSGITLHTRANLNYFVQGCKARKIIWPESKIEPLIFNRSIFTDCKADIDMSWLKCSDIVDIDSHEFFKGCGRIIDFGSLQFKASTLERMSSGRDISELESFPIISVADQISLLGFVQDCKNLRKFILPAYLNGVTATSLSVCFSGDTSLEEIDLTGLKNTSTCYFSRMFSNCTSLRKVIIPGLSLTREQARADRDLFKNCHDLEITCSENFKQWLIYFNAVPANVIWHIV